MLACSTARRLGAKEANVTFVKRIRLLLVDDHPVLRAGLANLLRLEPDVEVAGEAGSGETAVGMWQQCRPDVCLLDLSMPGIGGVETIRRIRTVAPGAEIVVLTSSESPDHATQALKAGASAYLTKNVPYPEIVSVIRRVHKGERSIRKGVAETGPRANGKPQLLSARELEVLKAIRGGKSTTEISRALGIVERTVKFHVTSILDKLGASDRTGAVIRGFELGLLQVDAEQ